MLRILAPFIIIALFLSGCGGKNTSTPASSSGSQNPPATASNSPTPTPSSPAATASNSPSPTSSSSTASASGWLKYSNNTEKVSFEYPSSWVKGDASTYKANTKEIITEPDNGQNYNASLVLEDLGTLGAPDARGVADLFNRSAAKLGFQDYKQISFEERKYGSNTAGILTASYKTAKTGTAVKIVQYIVPLNYKFYLLTMYASEETFDTHKPQFDHIIDSFEVSE